MKRIAALWLTMILLLGSAASAETLTLSMIGDCTVGEQYCYRGYQSGYTYKVGQTGLAYPFSLAADLFAADDLTIANCEGNFTTRKSGGKFMSLCAPQEFAEVFKLGNVDVVNTANNHMRDFGKGGIQDTKDALTAHGIAYFGDNDLYVTELKGAKIGMVGFTYPISESKLKRYKKKIAELREQGCTFVIASVHWGKETSYNLNSEQKKGGKKLIDMGADMVYGHGSHTVQPFEIYKGKLIFYSLANFTFGANAAPKDDDTVVVQVTFQVDENGACIPAELTAIPYKMHKDKDFRPYPIEDQEGKEQVWYKLMHTGRDDLKTGIPESFATTGVMTFDGADMTVTDEGK